MIRVKPVEGFRVRHPDGTLMPPEGGEVNELDPYWHRRIEDVDVLIEAPPPPANKKG